MHYTTPKVYLIAQTQIVEDGMVAWLNSLGAKDYTWNQSESHAENLIMAAAKRCYMAFEVGLNPNITKVRKDISEYITNILSSGHGSVLEHAHFSFAIENVSRVFTGEMNRHRAGMAISEGSMRFISFEDLGLVKTKSMKLGKDIYDAMINDFLAVSFVNSELAYNDLMSEMSMEGYDNLPMSRKKELTSKARRAIGMGISTGGIWTGNIRALRHICELRGTKYSEEEILVVIQQMLKILIDKCPNLFGDFTQDDAGFWSPKYSKV